MRWVLALACVGRRAVDRVPDPRRPLPRPGCTLLMAVAFVCLRRGPALERPPAALLLPGPLPAGRHRRRRGRRAPVAVLVAPRPGSPEHHRPGGRGRGDRAGRPSCSSRSRCARCPGGDAARRRQLLVVPARQRRSTSRASSGRGRGGTTPATRARPAYAEYRDLVNTMRRHRRGARLRTVVLGVREGDQPLRHADGADAPAALDRRLHRLDGGAVLRGVGHHAVPLPHPGGAQRRAERRAARPALRQLRHRRRRAAPAADGRALLPGHVRAGHHRGPRPPRPHRAGHLRARG